MTDGVVLPMLDLDCEEMVFIAIFLFKLLLFFSLVFLLNVVWSCIIERNVVFEFEAQRSYFGMCHSFFRDKMFGVVE